MNVAKYSKAIAAAAAAIGIAVADNVFDWNDAFQVITAVLVSAGIVYAAPPNRN